jgi:ethanolamine utilization protein EutN
MIIARVVDNVVATQKHESHFGKIILLVQPLDLLGQEVGEPIVALDAVSAGIGDCVLVVQEGYSAMTSVGRPNSPIDASVIGIIDEFHVSDSENSE